MDVTTLGFSGPVVSRLGLGTASIGRPGYINEGHSVDLGGKTDKASMQTNAFAVLDTARQLGVTYFDAARSYGDAEKFLAAWLQRLARSGGELADVTVGSKWGYRYVADWKVDAVKHEIKDHSLPMFERQYSETNHILGSHLDLYQIHSVTPDSPVLSSPETLRRLAELKESGVLIGLTTSGPFQARIIRKARTILEGSKPLFDVVQSTWNVLEPSAGPALQEANDAGVGVIIKEALANGRLTSRGDFSRQLSGSG